MLNEVAKTQAGGFAVQFSLTESSVVVSIATRDWEVRGTGRGAACLQAPAQLQYRQGTGIGTKPNSGLSSSVWAHAA